MTLYYTQFPTAFDNVLSNFLRKKCLTQGRLNYSHQKSCSEVFQCDAVTALKPIGSRSRSIETKKFDKQTRQVVLSEFQRYYGRYLAAVEFGQHLAAVAASKKEEADVPIQQAEFE